MENVAPYITREYLFDKQAVAYTVDAMTIDVLMDWSNDVVELLRNWPEGQDCRLLYDLSARGIGVPYLVMTAHEIFNVGLTPRGGKRVNQILESRPNLKIRLALVMSNTLSGQLVQKFARRVEQIEHQIYFDRDAALDWLMQRTNSKE